MWRRGAPFTGPISTSPMACLRTATAIGAPRGASFLWLDMSASGGGEAATKTLWKGCGVKVLPGRYLAHGEADGINPGMDFVRAALVHDAEATSEALARIVATLG